MTTSDYIALVASCTAIAALLATIWLLHLTRQHNVKSMRPVLDLTADLLKGCVVQYTLANHGVGPAFITKVSYLVDGVRYSECEPDDIRQFLSKLGFSRDELHLHCITQLENCPIGVDKQVRLLGFPGTELDDEYHEYMCRLLRDLAIEVEYKSVYGESYLVRLSRNV
ncbi:hypothetical protein [Vibrio mimicus]|uniref:hypothetical protein n=1 Tax=Vibrio mimicus TaxID=674 RepID=UPI0006ACCCB3|nr:hypothetical protein [Vibrio mimicus]